MIRFSHMMAVLGAAAPPDAAVIRRTAQEVVRRPEFQLAAPADQGGNFLAWLLKLLRDLLEPLFNAVGKLWDISPALAVVVVVLLAIALVALLAHIVVMFRSALASRGWPARRAAIDRQSRDPAEYERGAAYAAGRQDYIGAIRMLFRACLLRLEQVSKRTPRPGTTNREYLRRYQGTAVHGALAEFVDTIDAKWYGGGLCGPQDYVRCQEAHALVRNTTGGLANAHGA